MDHHGLNVSEALELETLSSIFYMNIKMFYRAYMFICMAVGGIKF
jgi:hypothetical protein